MVQPSGMSAKVMIVDDEESILKGIKLNLGRSFKISLANGSEEALFKMESEGPFAVVVSDMRMPTDGWSHPVAKIKESSPDTLCILLTGHADFEFGGSQALQSGFLYKILNKPCSPEKVEKYNPECSCV